jgi:hypothetical protein
MLYPRLRSAIAHDLTGAILGLLVGLLAGWASSGDRPINTESVIAAAVFMTSQGLICGSVLEMLRQRRDPDLGEGIRVGTAYGWLISGPIMAGTWLPVDYAVILAIVGGAVGVAACIWRFPGRWDEAAERMLSRLLIGRAARLTTMVRGAATGAGIGVGLTVLLVGVYLHMHPHPADQSFARVQGYYSAVGLCALMGAGLGLLRGPKANAERPPDDLARAITTAGLGGLTLSTAVVPGLWLGTEQGIAGWGLGGSVMLVVGTMGLIGLFSATVSVIASGLVPVERRPPRKKRRGAKPLPTGGNQP